MKKATIILAVLAAALMIGGCGTVKKVNIESNPSKALVISHENEKVDDSFFINYYDPTPGQYRFNFWGKNSKVYVTAEKRGYKAETREVTKDSGTALSFNLERIEGVPEKVFDEENLKTGTFYLLPTDVEVLIHTGAGRLGKQKFSAEMSKTVSDNFFAALQDAVQSNEHMKLPTSPDDPVIEKWGTISEPLNKYLKTLKVKRLKFYSTPPYIDKKVEGFSKFRENLNGQNGSEVPYLLYIWSKCISETKGRKTANLLLGVLGGAMSGINPTFIYDPSAFNPTSGTLVVLYVIDAATSEVLYIEPRYFRVDISKEKHLKKVADLIGLFPFTGKKSS
jgi:hypothetical protein